MEEKEFKPFVSSDTVLPELTPVSIFLGIILAIVFGGANAYLGLRVGMTVSASIPAAVVSMGVIRILLKRDSILENNIVQTIGSAGESVAAGAIFTLPAMFLWSEQWGTDSPSLFEIFFISVCGGLLGILFMVPLRKALIVKEHNNLPYPEGKACAEVLLAGESGGNKSNKVFAGLGISALYKFIADGLKLFPSEVHYELNYYKGSAVGIDVLPALLGVGYICGARISSYMFSGGVLAWLVVIPLIALFGSGAVIFPSDIPINDLDSFGLWSNYVRYIGAGAVAAGGIISLIKSMPLIAVTFTQALKDYSNKDFGNKNIRCDRDLPLKLIISMIIVLILIIWIIPIIPVTLVGAVIIAVFGFFFATVSSRLVGLVGSSNNPVSGMTIATLLISTIILKATGNIGYSGMVGAISIGSIICIISAIAGDTSQDLKTGYILGATPANQQKGEFIGVIISSLTIGSVLFLLNKAWGYGSANLPAPQATLMKMVVEGVMNGNLPWSLVAVGCLIAITIEIIGIPVLPFAVGLYLPIHLSAGIMVGGLLRLFIEQKGGISEENRKSSIENGILYTSGMIAGEGIVGILLAVLAVIPFKSGTLDEFVNVSEYINFGNIGALVVFVLFILLILKSIYIKSGK